MIRWIAGVVVILGCGYLGVSYARTGETRIRQLEMLERMFCQLEFNMGFLVQPLWEAMNGVSEGYSGAVSRLFSLVADRLVKNREILPETAFQLARGEITGIRLKEEEWTILQEFFRHAGRGDRGNTRDGIRMTVAKLKTVRETALRDQEKNGKLWRSMGFLGGLFIVLLLV